MSLRFTLMERFRAFMHPLDDPRVTRLASKLANAERKLALLEEDVALSKPVLQQVNKIQNLILDLEGVTACSLVEANNTLRELRLDASIAEVRSCVSHIKDDAREFNEQQPSE